jgi:hypothetical protein
MTPSDVTTPVGDRAEYRYGNSTRRASVAFLGFFLVWIGLIVWAYFAGVDESMRRVSPAGLLGLISVPFGMSLLCLYWMNQVFGTIAVDSEGLEIIRPLSRLRREFHEFDRLEPLRSNKEGFILWTPEEKAFKVDTNGLVGAKDLRYFVRSRIVPGPRRASEETEFRLLVPKGFIVMMAVVAAILALGPWMTSSRPQSAPWLSHLMSAFCALSTVVIVVELSTMKVRLFPDRVEKGGILGKQTVRFADVKQVELGFMVARGGSAEVVRLIHSGRDFTLSPQFSHFNQLCDTLIGRCENAKVVDSRPAEYR